MSSDPETTTTVTHENKNKRRIGLLAMLLIATAIVVFFAPSKGETTVIVKHSATGPMCTLTSLDSFTTGDFGSEKVPCSEVGNRVVYRIDYPTK